MGDFGKTNMRFCLSARFGARALDSLEPIAW
jgi:hypothetical protein